MALVSNQLALGKRTALILVDLINGFTDPKCELGTDCPAVIAANNSLLKQFRQRGWPVFFTTVVYHNAQQASVFRKKLPVLNCLKAGSHWVKVDARLAKQDNEVLIEKQFASAFFDTDLNQQLKQADVDTLVVTGLTTSGCVRATVVDGLQHNYPVFVPKQAVSDRNLEAHEANLFDMNFKYAQIVELDDLQKMLST
jgi:nicotinamidase-related amidase